MENKTIWIIGGLAAAAVGVYLYRKNKPGSGPDVAIVANDGGSGTVIPNPVVKVSPVLPTYEEYSPPQRDTTGVRADVPLYLQPAQPTQPAYVEAYNPQVPGPAIVPIYTPSPHAPIEKEIFNPDQNLQPPRILAAGKYPPGTLIQSGEGKIWLINERGERQWITSMKKIESMGYKKSDVIKVASSVPGTIPRGSDISGAGSLGFAYILS